MKGRSHVARRPLLVSLAMMVACAGTSLTAQKSPHFGEASFQHIVVLGSFNSTDDRRSFEDLVVGALKEKGCDAVASLSFLVPERKYSKEELEGIFAENGFDGILTMKIADVEESRTDIAQTFYDPLQPYLESWYPFWTDGIFFLTRGGYHEKHTEVFVESALFSLRTGKLAWFGCSDTSRVHSVAKLASSLGPAVAKELKKEKLIP
jgi:hypothetical protein